MGDLEKKQERVMEEEDKERLVEGVAVLDFDMLCSTVALRAAHGKWGKLGVEDRGRRRRGGCCPCYRFGKNMKRADFGSCYIQGAIYFLLAIGAFLNFIAFAVTRRHCYLYLIVAFGAYLGFFRTRIRKKFNIIVGVFCNCL
ncbi:hypothetical protein GmHk_08G021484 [Glycine max]|nr:hypothetical protein JHK85_021042 [Glycine max]KAH1236226.1 hypothetical protein GmHk_08G021484 [Glycine max]